MTQKSKRGFAAMDAAKQRAIASKGGQASGGNFAHDRARASEAGRNGDGRAAATLPRIASEPPKPAARADSDSLSSARGGAENRAGINDVWKGTSTRGPYSGSAGRGAL